MASAGGVPEALVGALRAMLDDASLDGAFVAAAISLPSASELIDDIPGVDPIVLHDVRCALGSTGCASEWHRWGSSFLYSLVGAVWRRHLPGPLPVSLMTTSQALKS